MSAPFVALEGLTKRYGSNLVLDGIDLEIEAGTCIGLLGENGAGKSTLVGIMSGKTPATSGELRIDGRAVTLRTPREARALGIQLIPQELAYLPALSVAENLILPNWPRGRWTVSQRWVRRTGQEALERIGIDIDVRRTMSELTLADRQLVEIAKALLGDARLLILDEPTSSLHARETEFLLDKLRALKAQGVAMVFVSHHLEETFAISDQIVVLRNGRIEAHRPTAAITTGEAVAAMLGAEYESPAETRTASIGSPAIELQSWSAATKPSLDDCSLTLHRGEVLGVFGLVGSGAETIARGLSGHQRGVAGSIRIDGRQHAVPRSPRAADRLGIAYVPAERKTDGVALNQTIVDNITVRTLPRFSLGGLLRRRAQLSSAAELADGIDVRRRSITQEVGELSGGNQQKVVLASRLASRPPILVLHEPTRGVDIGSRSRIHRELARAADGGAAVLLVTSDVQEAIDATDRLVILRDGVVVGELSGSEKTKSAALAAAAGGTR